MAWIFYLGAALPNQGPVQDWGTGWAGIGTWQLTWVGLDVFEVAGLAATGYLLRRSHRQTRTAALLAATTRVLACPAPQARSPRGTGAAIGAAPYGHARPLTASDALLTMVLRDQSLLRCRIAGLARASGCEAGPDARHLGRFLGLTEADV